MTLAAALLLVLVIVLFILLAARAVEAAIARIEQANKDLNEVDAAYDARTPEQRARQAGRQAAADIRSSAEYERERFACAFGSPHPSAEL